MAKKHKSTASTNKNISIDGDVVDSTLIVGDNNTLIQKFFNIFKSDSETLEHRNRRILLGHVENAWIKSVLDASLHGAALLDLGIKQDPEAVTKYPWAIKRESTDETLPTGTSMLEIFDSIGMGRSLLILGAPGSGKTTMLLELARQLIARAREDVTQPIPMVFNLASWTEKLTLADWLAQELNNLYSVPRKTAPDWVKGNKLLLLLDGLDEVRQESRAKCVEAINEFRKQNGLTSLAVCSRSQDYADLKAKLSFEGAIEVQPLTQEQIAEFFNRFGGEMTGIKQALEKDSSLREMAETPLFLSIMLMAYRDKRDVEILASGDQKEKHKYLFDTYIERMFERRTEHATFKKQDMLRWLSWLAKMVIAANEMLFKLENIQPKWLGHKKRWGFKWIIGLIYGLSFGVLFGVGLTIFFGVKIGLFGGVIVGLLLIALANIFGFGILKDIKTVDTLRLTWNQFGLALLGALIGGLCIGISFGMGQLTNQLGEGVRAGLTIGLFTFLIVFLSRFDIKPISQTIFPEQRISFSTRNFILTFLSGFVCLGGFYVAILGWSAGLIFGLGFGLIVGLGFGGDFLIRHYVLRFILARNNLLPWRLVPFLDHCVDLIFLRRVGGGYIFVHRLLMEHFAEMYVETPPPPPRAGRSL